VHGALDDAPAVVNLPGPLVDAAWLERAMGHPDLVVADVRWYPDRLGRDAYQLGHIPGAVFLDMDADLAGPVAGDSGRHPLPAPVDFARAMERAGIDEGSAVVAYDDAGGSNAARLWWMLAVTGHQAAVLDGGLPAWRGELEPGPGVERRRGTFAPRPWPADRLVDVGQANALRRDPSAVVLDARATERYRGEVEPIDAVAGHIPGAKNAPWAANLDPQTGRFLQPEELRRRYAALGVDGKRTVVAYCGSGVTSCHDVLALEVAGFRGAKLYVGSWSGWIAGVSRPMAKGPDPG
jgi:thiosulfate/3-mercaptopyruvate sulfurtransferase